MKKINCNDWAPCSKPLPYERSALYVYDDGGLAIFYYRLGVVIYHFLDKDLSRFRMIGAPHLYLLLTR